MREGSTETVSAAEETAISELARDDVERRKFLKMAASVGAAGALTALIAACGDDDESTTTSGGGGSTSTGGGGSGRPPAGMFGSGDLGIVNYALTLEYVEADFYAAVADSGLFKGDPNLPTLQMFGEQEATHAETLLGVAKSLGKPAPKPKTDFAKALKSKKTVVDTAAMVENIGAAAYLGQAGNIKSKEILASALAIHTVEARHAAVLNQVRSAGSFTEGEFLGIVPDGPFGLPATADTVLPLVTPFIVS